MYRKSVFHMCISVAQSPPPENLLHGQTGNDSKVSHLHVMSFDKLEFNMKTFASTCSFRQDLHIN